MIVTFTQRVNTKTEKTGLPLACRNISANWGSCRWVRSQPVVSYLLRAAIFPLTPPGFFGLGHCTPASRGEHGRIRETHTCAENTQGASRNTWSWCLKTFVLTGPNATPLCHFLWDPSTFPFPLSLFSVTSVTFC